MQKINFIKMQGLGNDFVIVDKRNLDLKISRDIIRKLSDRNIGVGCDQLIIIDSHDDKNIDAKIEIFNHDGKRSEACGNGSRCVAKLLFNELRKDKINILSDAGVLKASKEKNGNISINLGRLSYQWNEIPLIKKLDTLKMPLKLDGLSNGVAINVGNPHIIFFGNNIENINLEQIGPKIENNKIFPNKTNVEIVEIINTKKIKMRVWERGVGITMACGSGACASVYAGQLKNLLDNNVEVQLEHGSLFISILNEEAILTGPAKISFHGNIEI